MSAGKYRTGDELDRMIDEVGLEQQAQLLPGTPLVQRSTAAPPTRRTVSPAGSDGQDAWVWDDNAENEAKLRKLFEMIDRVEQTEDLIMAGTVETAKDNEGSAAAPGEGGISSTELMHMLVNLGEDMPPEQADEMVDLIDSDGSQEIEFSEFYAVLTGRIPLDGSASAPPSKSRPTGQSIREIRRHFNAVDEDGGGFLDKDEVGELGEKMGNLQRRHLVDAMAAMDPSKTGQVTFDMFKNWLIDSKDGRKWYDFLVLPESAVVAMRRKAAQDDLLPPAGTAADRWKRLAVLMKLLDQATLLWGLPNDMYGVNEKQSEAVLAGKPGELNPEELEKEAMAMPFFLHPNKPIREAWDVIQVFLLLYLLIVIPLRFAFNIEIKPGSAAFWIDVFVDVYFIVDVGFNFRTAYYDKRGTIVIDQRLITRNYLTSWFLIDFITCLPISYVLMVTGEGADASRGKEVRAAKILRLLKLGKLLRVARLVRLIERYQEYLREIWNIMGGWILSLVIFFLAHTVACLWYYLGSINQEPHGSAPGETGWVQRVFGPSCEVQRDEELQLVGSQPVTPSASASRSGEEQEVESGCLEQDRTSRYITSVYWALTTVSTVGYGDITAETDIEKVASAMTMLFGAIIFAGITGQMASRFMASKGAVQYFNTRMDEIRQFLRDKNVPTRHRRKIEAHFSLLWGRAAIYNEAEILALLPRTLRNPVLDQVYIPLLSHVAVFSSLSQNSKGREVLALISRELVSTVSMPRNVVMMEGDYGHEMFFIQEGEVEVYQQNTTTKAAAEKNLEHGDFRNGLGVRLGRLGPGSFFGERAILARGNGWQNGLRSRTAVSRNECRFYVLEKRSVDLLRKQIPALHKHMIEVEKGLDGEKHLRLEDGEWSSRGELGALQVQLDNLEVRTMAQHNALEAKLDRLISLVEGR